MQNFELMLQLRKIEQLLGNIYSQQESMLKCLVGIQPTKNLDNGTAVMHIPSSGTKCATLTVNELQEILGLSRPEAYDLVKQDDFPAFRIGRKILISRSGLQHWISQQITVFTERGAA